MKDIYFITNENEIIDKDQYEIFYNSWINNGWFKPQLLNIDNNYINRHVFLKKLIKNINLKLLKLNKLNKVLIQEYIHLLSKILNIPNIYSREISTTTKIITNNCNQQIINSDGIIHGKAWITDINMINYDFTIQKAIELEKKYNFIVFNKFKEDYFNQNSLIYCSKLITANNINRLLSEETNNSINDFLSEYNLFLSETDLFRDYSDSLNENDKLIIFQSFYNNNSRLQDNIKSTLKQETKKQTKKTIDSFI